MKVKEKAASVRYIMAVMLTPGAGECKPEVYVTLVLLTK